MKPFTQEALEWCREQRDQSVAALTSIDRDGWRHTLQVGNQPPQDVTEQWANRERRTIERMERLIALWEARDA